MTADLFTPEEKNEPNSEAPFEVVDPNKDWEAELVGEGKKYSDHKALARAAAEKEAFINRLKRELEVTRGDLNSRKAVEEMLTELRKTKPEEQVAPPQAPESPQALTPENLAELIEKELSKRLTQEKQVQNVEAAKAKLKDAWGADWQGKLHEATRELGVGQDFLEDLARKSPEAFLRTVGATAQKKEKDTFTGSPTPSVYNPSKAGSLHGAKTFSYYENIRKTNPNEYWTPKIQNEMYKQAQTLGQDFFNN